MIASSLTGEPRLSSESICEFAVNQLRRPNFHPFPPCPPRNVIFTETVKPRTRGPWASGRPPVSSDYFRDLVSSLTYFPDDRESFQAETKGLFLSRWRMGFLLGMINNVVSKLMKLTFAPGMCFGFFFFFCIFIVKEGIASISVWLRHAVPIFISRVISISSGKKGKVRLNGYVETSSKYEKKNP